MRGRALLALLLASTGATVGCGPAATPKPAAPQTADRGALTTHHTTYDGVSDGTVLLLDSNGNPIVRGSTVAFSPERTCGSCHDVDVVTRGYHFQQGRTDASNAIVVSDTFNPTKPWLLSAGMYGKT